MKKHHHKKRNVKNVHKCRFCGALISGNFAKGDTFPVRVVDTKTRKELEGYLACKTCYDAIEE